jgi:hypothetical protein
MRIMSLIDQPDVIKKHPSTLRSMGGLPCSTGEKSFRKRTYLRSILQPDDLKASYRNRAADVQPYPQIRVRLT